MSDTNVTDVNAEKLSAAEAELASMKASMEALAAKNAELLEPVKARLKSTLDAAPDAVKKFYEGKELDPVKDLAQVEAEVEKYKAMEVEASRKSREDLDAYRAGLKAKYGTNLPPMDKIIADSVKVEAKKTESKNVEEPSQNGSEKVQMYTDLVKKPNLNNEEFRSITGRLSSMASYINARKSVAVGAKD